jgi:arginase family enzyme
VVLGGDCSMLLGSLLGMAGRGRHGVVFIDGHIDFYPPHIEEWDGRAANSELAFAAGRPLSQDEMITLLSAVARHQRAPGIQLTIYNPDADPDGSAGRAFARAVGTALRVPLR